MGYTEKLYGVVQVGAEAAIDLTSAATASFSKAFLSRFRMQRIALLVSTATVSTVNIVVTFYRRPTYGSDVGRVSLGTVVVPTAVAVGKVYYKDISDLPFASTDLNAGEQLIYVVSTAAAGGGAAGQALAVCEGYYVPESASNQANMVASS